MRVIPALLVLTLCCPVLAGCTSFPDLDRIDLGADATAGTPELVPLEPLLAAATAARATPTEATALTTRADALRARAAALQRRGAIDADTRVRMQTGVPTDATEVSAPTN